MHANDSGHHLIGYALAAAIVVILAAAKVHQRRRSEPSGRNLSWTIALLCLALLAYAWSHDRRHELSVLAVPIAPPQLWLFQGLALAFIALIALAAARRRDEAGARVDGQSRIGIGVQGAALLIVWLGPVKATLQWTSPAALAGCAAVLLLMAGVLALFAASSSALGKNWSIKARTLNDHALVRSGPYAHVRHPIYLAMLLVLLAIGADAQKGQDIEDGELRRAHIAGGLERHIPAVGGRGHAPSGLGRGNRTVARWKKGEDPACPQAFDRDALNVGWRTKLCARAVRGSAKMTLAIDRLAGPELDHRSHSSSLA
jgi:protein-S-isoprenylcysteine O-methyltransferase Ste14